MSNPTEVIEIEGDNDKDEANESENPNLHRKRKCTSQVWQDFEKFKGPNGESLAKCKHCKRNYTGVNGTTHLKKHLEKCLYAKKQNRPIDQAMLSLKKNASNSIAKVENFKFDQEKSRMDFATMIIKHNYSFKMAEHEYFEIFCNGLQPSFKLMSRNMTRADIVKVYLREKDKLYNYLDQLSSRITLTTDLWTSDHQNLGYIRLTAHFIDDEWVLKKKIINYKYIRCPHDAETLAKSITDMVLDWNIDRKLFAMVVDNATTNDVMIRNLKSWLCNKDVLPLTGDLFQVRCSAHILNLIVQDGLLDAGKLVSKIRDSVKYVNRTPSTEQKFDYAINQVKLKGRKKAALDCPTRWNSTFDMLDSALGMIEAFCRLAEIDRNYKHNPSDEEWEVAKILCNCLRTFYEATKHFSGTNFPTSNVFFPDVCRIQLHLLEWENSGHSFLHSMAIRMKVKFTKYWEECSLVLAIAVVLDPRFKMDLVEYYYGKIYGEDACKYVERVNNALLDLFNEYKNESSQLLSHGSDLGATSSCNDPTSSSSDNLSGFDEWYARSRVSNILIKKKTELDLYLEEPMFPRNENFNILHWWKVNSGKHPTLSKVARDVLAVPATTVASEATFSVGGGVIDETRARLLPDIVEALVTTNDWIESTKKTSTEEKCNK